MSRRENRGQTETESDNGGVVSGTPVAEAALFRVVRSGDAATLTWASAAFCSLTGLDPNTLPVSLEQWLETYVHPDDRSAATASIEAVSKRKGARKEYRVRSPSENREGNWFWLREELLLRDHDPKKCECLYMVSDVTYERNLQDELRAAKDDLEQTVALNNIEIAQTSLQYLELIDSSVQGIFVHDGEMIGYANGALATMLGYSGAKDLIGVGKIWDLFAADEVARMKSYRDNRVKGDPVPNTYQCQMMRRDGSTMWAEVRVSLPRWKGKTGYLGLVIDISERRASEEAMMTARREAERANKLKSDFLAKMSHELRTPLNAIIGFSQSLGTQGLDVLTQDRLMEYTGYIQDGAEHLLHIVNEILDLSKIEAGRYELEEGPVSLRDVILRAREMVSGLAQARNVTVLTSGLDDSEVKAYADERALLQVVLNLLSNAVKYGRAGCEVNVVVTDPDAEDGISIVISDAGDGIPPERMDFILTPFGRLGNNDAYKSGGTGLGLPIVKSLIDMHGGTFDIDSTVGVGTTVTVKLPAARRLL
ncbi:PAS domain S-box protein [Hwanghaeella grinnelliae]|uniref:histidine kinase n=1 Tax=Hwanghaeella grinnelliae TaxID=2500179 RepID=A0A3S2Z5K6_9PROT|nr:ATP-binding protein [Hwanghaeella grinnelliae]RVU33632.1 PAS domain S-box protein [Hwanghaeella grinnelliae]